MSQLKLMLSLSQYKCLLPLPYRSQVVKFPEEDLRETVDTVAVELKQSLIFVSFAVTQQSVSFFDLQQMLSNLPTLELIILGEV